MSRVVDENGKATGWAKAIGFGFAAWSAMLPIAVWLFDQSVTKQLDRMEHWNEENLQVHAEMQRRLTTVEVTQKEVLRRLDERDSAARDQEQQPRQHPPR